MNSEELIDVGNIDSLFDEESYKEVGTLIEPMDEEAYLNRYKVLAEDVKAPIENPNIYKDTQFDSLDEIFDVPREPIPEREPPPAGLIDQSVAVAQEFVRGPLEGLQGIYDTFEDIDHALQDLGVPNYSVYWDDKEGLKFGTVSKDKSDTFSPFNQNVTQFAPDVDENAETIVSEFVNEATEFLTAYAFAGAAIAPLKAGALATGAVRGGAADFADYEMESIIQMAEDIPAFAPYISEWMVADEDDPELIQRAYVALEGIGLGMLADKIIDMTRSGIKKYKANRNNNNNKTDTNVKQQETPKVEEPESTGTPEAASEAPTKTENVQSGSPDGGTTTETSTKAEVKEGLTDAELDISDEIQALYRADPTNPNLAKVYDEMAAAGKIEDRPSTIREVTPDQLERILKGIESDPDNLTIEYFNIHRMGNTQKEIVDTINYTAQAFDGGQGLNSYTPEFRPAEVTAQEVAKDLGMDSKDIIKNLEEVAGITGELDVWLGKARVLQVQAGNEAYGLASKVISDQATMEEQIEFVRRLGVLEQLNEIMTGMKTGTGRGLASLNIHTTDYLTEEMQKVLKNRVCRL